MSRFDEVVAQMSTAKPYEKGVYFKIEDEGQYILEITKAIFKPKGDTDTEGFVVETKVESSSNPGVAVGAPRTLTFWIKAQSGWENRFFSFLTSALGADTPVADVARAIGDDDARKRLGYPENFMVGQRVGAVGFPQTTKKGVKILGMKYFPAPAAS